MKMNKILLAAIGIALASVTLNANALTATTTIAPSLTISSTCAINTATIAAFAGQAFGVSAVPAPAAGALTVTCAGGVATYDIGADWGLSSGHSATQRVLTNGVDNITYNLGISGTGLSTSPVTNWTDKGITTATMTSGAKATQGSPNGAGDSYVISATIQESAANMAGKSAGLYSDSVTITVEW